MGKLSIPEYSIAITSLVILLFGLNQGFSQTNDTQFTTYQNQELGVSFEYPGNWLELDEQSRKQITEVVKQSLSGQNLTSNEKTVADSEPVASFINPDPNNPQSVTLVKDEFLKSITVEEYDEIGLKILDALGIKATIVENANTTISNQEANKAVIRVDQGPVRGELTSIDFFKDNEVTSIQIGPATSEDQSLIMDRIINSINFVN